MGAADAEAAAELDALNGVGHAVGLRFQSRTRLNASVSDGEVRYDFRSERDLETPAVELRGIEAPTYCEDTAAGVLRARIVVPDAELAVAQRERGGVTLVLVDCRGSPEWACRPDLIRDVESAVPPGWLVRPDREGMGFGGEPAAGDVAKWAAKHDAARVAWIQLKVRGQAIIQKNGYEEHYAEARAALRLWQTRGNPTVLEQWQTEPVKGGGWSAEEAALTALRRAIDAFGERTRAGRHQGTAGSARW